MQAKANPTMRALRIEAIAFLSEVRGALYIFSTRQLLRSEHQRRGDATDLFFTT